MPASTPFAFDGFASPSYTQVPDELFDALMPSLADAELRVLLYIVRRTFGFKRDADAISLSQMVSGITTRDGRVLDHGTGLSKATVARGLKGLRAKGIILAERRSSPERGHEATSYRLRFKVDAPGVGRPLSHQQDKPCLSRETHNKQPTEKRILSIRMRCPLGVPREYRRGEIPNRSSDNRIKADHHRRWGVSPACSSTGCAGMWAGRSARRSAW